MSIDDLMIESDPFSSDATYCTIVGPGSQVGSGVSNTFLYGDSLLCEVSNTVMIGDKIHGQVIPWSVKLLLRLFPRRIEWILRNLVGPDAKPFGGIR